MQSNWASGSNSQILFNKGGAPARNKQTTTKYVCLQNLMSDDNHNHNRSYVIFLFVYMFVRSVTLHYHNLIGYYCDSILSFYSPLVLLIQLSITNV